MTPQRRVSTLLMVWIYQLHVWQFNCSDDGIKWSSICQGKVGTLECPKGSVVEVTGAYYANRELGCPRNTTPVHDADCYQQFDSFDVNGCNRTNICSVDWRSDSPFLVKCNESSYYVNFQSFCYSCQDDTAITASKGNRTCVGLKPDDAFTQDNVTGRQENYTTQSTPLNDTAADHQNYSSPSPTQYDGTVPTTIENRNATPTDDVSQNGQDSHENYVGIIVGVGASCLILGLLIGTGLGFWFYRKKTAQNLKRKNGNRNRDYLTPIPNISDRVFHVNSVGLESDQSGGIYESIRQDSDIKTDTNSIPSFVI